jgi:hypothetical protein
VTFKWKDYLIKGRDTLDVAEFICFSSASCRTASTAETDYPALQATEISSCSAEVEITPICAEFLVELRGFERLTSAVQGHTRGLDDGAASVLERP